MSLVLSGPPAPVDQPRTRIRARRTRRLRASTDAVGALTGFGCLLFLIPSVLVLGPLGAAGSPASVFGLGCLLWWFSARALPMLPLARGQQPVRVAMAVFAAAMLVSYAAGNLRPLDSDEISSADRGLLTLCSWCGLTLVAADMLCSRASIEKLLKRIVILCSVIATVGVVQFMTGVDLAGAVKIPGLSVNGVYQTIQTGGPVRRVAGTASHPIEYGMVLALVLPFALHYAFVATRRKNWWWAMTIVIGVAVPMSLSRSAILGVIAEFLVLFAVWPSRRRATSILIAPVFIVAMRLLIPGLVGTIFSIFSNAGDDPSLQGRADSRAAAGSLIAQSPWFGRGFNTYIPSKFVQLGLKGVNHGSLDNQYLGTVVEMGYVGLFALVFLLVVAIGVARGIRIRAADTEARDLGQAFLAAFLATAIGMATFDGLGFSMFTGLFFLLLGVAGASWHLTREDWRRRQRLLGSRVPPRARGPAGGHRHPVPASPGPHRSGAS
jgi:O-antigen ligase